MNIPEDNSGSRVSASQSNYGEYWLPESLSDLVHPPLYLAVAVWGWRLGRPFCREEVAQVFRLAPHRAGDVMTYIRRAGPDRIGSRQSYARVGGVRCRYLHIVADPGSEKGKTLREAPVTDAVSADDKEAGLQAMRRWFLRRPNPC